MLPLRLGTVNANGPQDSSSMRSPGRPRGDGQLSHRQAADRIDVPLYVKDEFGAFYKAMFDAR